MSKILTPACIADGPTLTRGEPASCMPVRCPLTLPPGYWLEGKRWRLRMSGVLSSTILDGVGTLNVSPGSLRIDLRLGGVIVWDSGAIALNTSGVYTSQPWALDVELVCRSIGIGTAATLMGVGTFSGAGIAGASTAPPAAGGVIVVPVNTAPAVGAGFNSFAALDVDVWSAAGTIAAGSRTVSQYHIEEV